MNPKTALNANFMRVTSFKAEYVHDYWTTHLKPVSSRRIVVRPLTVLEVLALMKARKNGCKYVKVYLPCPPRRLAGIVD